MTEQNYDKRYAQIARSLASHLAKYARDRREEDKKAIPLLHIELVTLWREEDKS